MFNPPLCPIDGPLSEAPTSKVQKSHGWVRSVRHSKAGLSFIELSDGLQPMALQVVARAEVLPNYAEVERLTAGCSLEVEGPMVASVGRLQAQELQAERLKVLGWVEEPESYPLAKKKHSLEHLRLHPHLRPRSRTFQAVAHLRHILAAAIHRFFEEEGFLWLASPILTQSDCEGAGETFSVVTEPEAPPFFGRPAYLTVSGQLHAEAYACALSKVYTFGPTFRAENSNTTRHLSEFWMVEPEAAFFDLQGIMNLAERFLVRLARTALEKGSAWLERLAELQERPDLMDELQKLARGPYERMSYGEAVRCLQKASVDFENPPFWGCDLKSEHERYLAEQVVKGPLMVTDYPAELKAFYMRANEDGRTVAAFDLLLPKWGELIGGSQREERLDCLLGKMEHFHVDAGNLSWYLDLRRYGTVPHSGFGLGFERLIAALSGLTNIRDALPFPRAPRWMEG